MSSCPPASLVLVVDDEWLLREELGSALRSDGWLTVLEASSGEAAVKLFNNQASIEVLITDIRLGGRLTGWDVARTFRASNAEGRVIYASGSPFDEKQRVANSLFFSKPCKIANVVSACRTRRS